MSEPTVLPADLTVTPIGYQGATAHTWTAGCAGLHPISERCPGSEPAATE